MGRALGSQAGALQVVGLAVREGTGLPSVAGPREWEGGGGRGQGWGRGQRSLSLQDKLAERKALLLQAVQR